MANLILLPGAASLMKFRNDPQAKQRMARGKTRSYEQIIVASSSKVEPKSVLPNSAFCLHHGEEEIRIGVFHNGIRNLSIVFRSARRSARGLIRRNGSRGDAVVVQKLAADNDEIVELPASVDFISSTSNAYVKQLVRLRTSAKARSAARSVMVVGAVPLREICCRLGPGQRSAGPEIRIDVLIVRQGAEISPEFEAISRRIVRVGPAVMSKLSGLESPPDSVGILKFPSTFCAFDSIAGSRASATESLLSVMERNWCESPRRILVLDRIQDPGNLGTLLRTVAAFSWDAVFLLPGCCDPFNDKALRAARGASFHVPVAMGEWAQVREFAAAKNLTLCAGDPKPAADGSGGNGGLVGPRETGLVGAESIVGKGQGLCLILGSEGQGISEEVKRDCARIGIAMPGNFESLNVAVAGGILMYALS